ncbi:hypothetical protein Ais01nite_14430 [Asanoa ishikariensis]|uniref:Uncharacterized protein n=1 Tax=Asanoa ishikariensis TaxID=137265 RepID=A0A1H3UIL4_9ACTN|nr:hypothetical protein [Asanoa ishikariensis]GIF63408.1 hypothetical protein Ais01nite_14430 [Asanoa ishikariensis]SDZ62303.1 hypothetical protein SAMN05421684_7430 [Asanoa ishikariensis]
MRHSRMLASLCAIVLAVAGGLAASAPAAAGQRCISTPSEYRAAWQAKQVRCVAPTLFATVHSRGDSFLYPAGFAYAWAGSSDNLEAYLKLRHRYGDEPAKVGVGILSYVGFPGLESWPYPMDLAVYTLPRGVHAKVPTFAAWYRLVDLGIPRAALRELERSYARIGRDQDVVDAFEHVTGCRRDDLLAGAFPSADIGCDADFLDALTAAGPSPYEGAESTQCFANFDEQYAGRRNAAALRAVLYQCQDAGFLNTGAGIGYNTYADPLICAPAAAQSVRQRYTGHEFVLPNASLDQLPAAVDIPLDIGEPGQRPYLHEGYC